MNCIKLLGQSLMARDFERQVAELQVLIGVQPICATEPINTTITGRLVNCQLSTS